METKKETLYGWVTSDLDKSQQCITAEAQYIELEGGERQYIIRPHFDKEASEAEYLAFIAPPEPTRDTMLNSVKSALQSAIDAQARSLTFDSGADVLMRAGFDNPYQSTAKVFAAWEASVWVAFDKLSGDPKAKLPTPEDAVVAMPTYPSK